MNAKRRVLIIHALRPTSRQTTIDHLLSFRHHLNDADVQYLHFAQPLPKEIEDGLSPDLTIVNYDFLNYRFSPLWPYMKNRFRDVARRSGKVVAITQDDFWAHRLLDNWCRSWGVDRILTPIENDLEVLYPWASKHVEFRTVLTGYAPANVPPIVPFRDRTIDVGQRVRTMPPHLGSYAQEKSDQAVQFAQHARNAGFHVDVSARVEDSLLGMKWLEFLGNCRFTVGMKGGASIADPYGLLYVRANAMAQRHPGRQLQTRDIGWLRRRDGRYRFAATSPRLFEAAATGTCQVLRRDNYLDCLEPWEDYLPLDEDFRNINEVLETMTDLERCSEIGRSATKKLIGSEKFAIRGLVLAATDGLLSDSPISQDRLWEDMGATNKLLSQILSRGYKDLHDAALVLIHELMTNSEVVDSIASSAIRQKVISLGETYWLDQVRAWSAKNRSLARSPWTWRPVPEEILRRNCER